MTGYELHHGGCLDILPGLAAQSVDAVICDPPYGTTACKWDSVIPFEPMWKELKRVVKKHAAIVLFGSQPFTSALVMSNVKWFKYCWTWDKVTGKGHLVAKKRPLQQTEEIVVFGQGGINYYPQLIKRSKPIKIKEWSRTSIMGGKQNPNHEHITDFKYPKTLLTFSWSPSTSLHPTEKPLELMEYLVRTYTNPGDTVLDFCFGSATTGAACGNLDRNFIGIEKYPLLDRPIHPKTNPDYFTLGSDRIATAYAPLRAMQAGVV